MTLFFLSGVSALFGMGSGHRVPDELGVGGLWEKGAPDLEGTLEWPRKWHSDSKEERELPGQP